MSRKYNSHDFETKMDSEGGFYSVLEYGVSAEDVDDPTIASILTEALPLFNKLEMLNAELYEYLTWQNGPKPQGEG